MKKDSFEKKLAAYITLAAAYIAAHPVEANAQVMYTDVTPDLVIHNSFFNLDLNNDGVTDFKLEHSQDAGGNWNPSSSSYSFWSNTNENAFPLGQNEIVGIATYYLSDYLPSPVPTGQIIDSNNQFATSPILHSHHYFSTNGNQTSGQYGYFFGLNRILGVKVLSGGLTYYGWARLDVVSNHIVLKDYAINLTPDSAIAAGDTGGCIPGSYTVTPTPSLTAINWICSGDSIQLKVNNAIGYSIQWKFNNQDIAGANDSIYYATSVGNYGVFISGTYCSQLYTSIRVDTIVPIPFYVVPNHINEHCNNADGSINAYVVPATNNYSFEWNTGATTQTITGLSSGTYFVTVYDVCFVNSSDTITVLNLSPHLVVTPTNGCIDSPTGACAASAMGGVPPYNYLWSTGSTTQNINSLFPGTYTVTVNDQFNCSDTLTVNILSNSPVLTSVSDSICEAGTGEILVTAQGGNQPYTYHWEDGSTGIALTNLNGGTYSLTVTENSGCTSSLDVTLYNLVPVPSITIANQILYSSYIGKNQWYLNDLNTQLQGDTLNNLTPPSNGFYWVEAIYPNGCSNISDSVYVGFVTGIENTEVPFISFEIINKKLLFHLADNALMGAQIDIVNELGQLAASVTVTSQTPSADLSALPGGIYFYHIRSKQKTYSGKFMIE